jgi:hypothetical protein
MTSARVYSLENRVDIVRDPSMPLPPVGVGPKLESEAVEPIGEDKINEQLGRHRETHTCAVLAHKLVTAGTSLWEEPVHNRRSPELGWRRRLSAHNQMEEVEQRHASHAGVVPIDHTAQALPVNEEIPAPKVAMSEAAWHVAEAPVESVPEAEDPSTHIGVANGCQGANLKGLCVLSSSAGVERCQKLEAIAEDRIGERVSWREPGQPSLDRPFDQSRLASTENPGQESNDPVGRMPLSEGLQRGYLGFDRACSRADCRADDGDVAEYDDAGLPDQVARRAECLTSHLARSEQSLIERGRPDRVPRADRERSPRESLDARCADRPLTQRPQRLFQVPHEGGHGRVAASAKCVQCLLCTHSRANRGRGSRGRASQSRPCVVARSRRWCAVDRDDRPRGVASEVPRGRDLHFGFNVRQRRTSGLECRGEGGVSNTEAQRAGRNHRRQPCAARIARTSVDRRPHEAHYQHEINVVASRGARFLHSEVTAPRRSWQARLVKGLAQWDSCVLRA